MKNFIKIIIFVSVVFLLAVAVWYSPVLFKGYNPQGAESTMLILGRNLAQTGIYGAENDLNVLLSSNLVKAESHTSASYNRLTAVLYGEIFKRTGELNEIDLLRLSIALHGLSLIILTLLVLYLFGFKIAAIFSLIYIFLPFNWLVSHGPGGYEFCLLFFALFFLFYLGGKEQKHSYIYLGLSGIFLALTCLSREDILVFVPFLFIYLWVIKQKRHLLYIFIPFLILFGCLWLPSALMKGGGGNVALLHLTTRVPEELISSDFSRYDHFFPDPYTYHFNREEFLKEYQNQLENPETGFLTETVLIKTGSNNGIRAPSFFERMEVGLALFFNHLARFLSLEEIGGPFIFLLMVLGLYHLRRKNRYLYRFSLGWVFSVIFLLSFVVLVGRPHLTDFGWVLVLWAALGLALLAEIISAYFHLNQMKSKIVLAVIVLMTLYGLVLANHVAWNTAFDHSQSLKIAAYSQKIEALDIKDQDVIAVPRDIQYRRLNYLTNKSLVIFQEKTIEDLFDNGELNSAFEKFKVKYILGYSDELSQKIVSQTEVLNIAANSIEPVQIRTSPAKIRLLNIFR